MEIMVTWMVQKTITAKDDDDYQRQLDEFDAELTKQGYTVDVESEEDNS